ncbi:uncharacterized protein LOC119099725 [Pollicipes pollicipes]|uniref:uncharacterized protein LOC119099725 n=1 Tax=Pollicipes pollicipes TaxID=41117 RepID=UPI001884B9EA|nr:uncharacterized protein LOC119099725 [Pollicipes pollicipes]
MDLDWGAILGESPISGAGYEPYPSLEPSPQLPPIQTKFWWQDGYVSDGDGFDMVSDNGSFVSRTPAHKAGRGRGRGQKQTAHDKPAAKKRKPAPKPAPLDEDTPTDGDDLFFRPAVKKRKPAPKEVNTATDGGDDLFVRPAVQRPLLTTAGGRQRKPTAKAAAPADDKPAAKKRKPTPKDVNAATDGDDDVFVRPHGPRRSRRPRAAAPVRYCFDSTLGFTTGDESELEPTDSEHVFLKPAAPAPKRARGRKRAVKVAAAPAPQDLNSSVLTRSARKLAGAPPLLAMDMNSSMARATARSS